MTRKRKGGSDGFGDRLLTGEPPVLVILLFVGGLALRLYLAVTCQAKPDYSDMAEYDYLAVQGSFNGSRPPLYPLFLRAIYAIWGNHNYVMVFVVQGVISAFAIFLMYRMVSRMWSRRAGIIASALYSVYPNILSYNLTTLTESLSVFCVIAMMSIAVSSLGARLKAVAQALITGAAVLIKPAFLFFVPGLFITLKRRFVFIAVLGALLAPWVLYNAVQQHRLILVSDTGALNFYMSYNPKATGIYMTIEGAEQMSQREFLKRGFDYIKNNKMAASEIVYRKLYTMLEAQYDHFVMKDIVRGNGAIYAVVYGYIVVLILGSIGLARCYRREHLSVVLPVASYFILIIALSIFKYRFRVLIEPLLIAYTAILFGGERTPLPSSVAASPKSRLATK
jgi:4-amino-4-deoxy-L-arabinose transferase-like glycosyltransferase